MIFTSTTAPFRTTPSVLFKEHGDTNGFPGTCAESNIFAVALPTNIDWLVYKPMLPFVAVANISDKPAKKRDVTFFKYDIKIPLEFPQIGVSYRSRKDDVVATMSDLGLVEDTNGRVSYFRGKLSLGALPRLIKSEPNPDTFVPAGVCSLNGFKAFIIATRTVFGSLTAFPGPDSSLPKISDEVEPLKEEQQSYNISKSRTIKKMAGKGHFFPYFHGMLVPDKRVTPDILTRMFYPLLGSVANKEETIRTLRNGWPTLSTTPSGLILQHMVFLIDLAYSHGMKPITFMPGGRYAGMFLMGDVGIVAKGIQHAPMPVNELYAEAKLYDSHDEVLKQIADVINSIPMIGQEDDVRLSIGPEVLVTPRMIHNLLRNLKFTNDDRNNLQRLFRKTAFQVTPLDPKDPKSVMRIFRSIKRAEYLEDSEPMFITDPAMFTRDIVVSSFAAFGAHAPSLFDATGTAVPILRATADNKKRYGDPGYLIHKRTHKDGNPVLPGGLIPVFIKSTAQAVEDFRAMSNASAISFRTTARGGVANTSYSVPKERTEEFAKMLVVFGPVADTKKRKEPPTDLADMSGKEIMELGERKVKKAKLTKEDADMWGNLEAQVNNDLTFTEKPAAEGDNDQDMFE